MSQPPPLPLDPDLLLAQTRFIRLLARNLLADENAVQDAVQQTLVAALEHPPRNERSLRSWLARVMRRIVGKARRKQESTTRWEIAAAVPEELPSTESLVQRAEMLRLVVDAVVALPEPARSLLLLRYLEEVPAQEIARRMQLPVETVRTRLKRALGRLRESLDEKYGGDRGAWCAALAPLTIKSAPAVAALAVAVPGAILMSAKLKLVAAILVVLALSAATWQVLDRERTVPARETTPVETSAAVPAQPSVERKAETSSPVERSPLAAGPSEATTPRDVALEVWGRVLSPGSVPVAGAAVVAERHEPAHYTGLELNASRMVSRLGSTVSDAGGEFRVPVTLSNPLDLRVTAAGFAPELVHDCRPGSPITVQLHAAATVLGRVTRAGEGGPVRGALVRVHRSHDSLGDRWESITDALGDYRIDSLPPGAVTLSVIPEIEVPEHIDVTLGDGGLVRKDFVVKPGGTVQGVVTDASTGKPIEGAEVGDGYYSSKTARTDANGHYALQGFWLPKNVISGIQVRAAGYGTKESFVEDLTDRTLEMNFALAPARRAKGRVTDTRGAPLEDAYVVAVAHEVGRGTSQKIDWRSARTGTDGTFLLDDLRPDSRHVLMARKEGLAAVVYDFPASESDSALIDLGDISLPEPGSIRGRTVDESGVAVGNVRVTLRGWNEDRARFSAEAVQDADFYVAEQECRTEADGSFVFAGLAPGTYTLQSQLPGNPSRPSEPSVQLEEGEDREGVEIVFARGLALDGVLLDAKNARVPLVWVEVRAEPPAPRRRAALVSQDGSFHFGGLAPGRYTLTAQPLPSAGDQFEKRMLLPATLSGVEAGRSDVRVTLEEGTLLSGKVQKPDGTPAFSAHVEAFDSKGRSVESGFTNERGEFAFVVPRETALKVTAKLANNLPRAAVEIPYEGPPMEATLEDVVAGQTDVVVTLRVSPGDR